MTGLSPSDFDFVSQLVRTEAAIVLEKGKEYLVESRLAPVAKSMGFKDIGALVDQLRRSASKDLSKKIVECITTHETSFFRDNEPFEVLRSDILPQLIETQRAKRELTIWCAASSSGQEPYSLLMLIREHFPELLNWKLKILASDISTSILERARAGIYSQLEVNRGLPVRYLVKYFDKNGRDWQLKPEIRSMVEFFELNLLHSFSKLERVDLVMMRNVLIYFDLDSKKQILSKVRALMTPHSRLFLGAAETTLNIDEQFERISFPRTSCYKKRPS